MRVLIDGLVWLNKGDLSPDQLSNLKGALTIFPSKTSEFDVEDPPPIALYKERTNPATNDSRIGIPRGFFENRKTEGHVEVLRVSDGAQMSGFGTLMRFNGPYAEQKKVVQIIQDYASTREWGGFLLKAGCGFGKTNTALEAARQLGLRTLILVHKEFFLRQWADRITEFFPDAKIGVIRQDRCDYSGCDFVIGMLQSIARDDGKGSKYPTEIYRAFGTIISDECHRISAQTWSGILPRFSARWRIGLTATPRRKDSAENVFFHHIGQILYSAKTMPVVPKVRRMFTESTIDSRGSERVNHTKLVSHLCSDVARTRQIAEDVAIAVKNGRKIMVVSERLDHLKKMSEDLWSVLLQMKLPFEPKVDFYTGEWFVPGKTSKGKPKKRTRSEAELKVAESANVIFATKQMVEEGLDIQALDVLVLTVPMGDVEQAAGRIRRNCLPVNEKCKRLCSWRAGECTGKPQPVVVDVIDEKIPQARRKWAKRRGFYTGIGAL